MGLPLATTTITVLEVVDGDDTVAPGPGATVASRVPAHFSRPTGTDRGVDMRLDCDPVPGLDHRHQVVDETTFERWSVAWVTQRRGLGLDHTEAGVNRATGAH